MSDQKKVVPGYLEIIVISMIVAGIAVFGYDRLYAPKIKVVDLKGYLRTQKALLVSGEIDKDQWQANLDKVGQIIDSEAQSHKNQVILLKEVVLKNGDELSIR